jgi:hypothetical protein
MNCISIYSTANATIHMGLFDSTDNAVMDCGLFDSTANAVINDGSTGVGKSPKG